MQNYFKEREYFIEHIWFHADGCHHHGNGVMIWNHKTGFHIAARVKRSKPLPSKKEIKIISFNQGTLIRLKLDNELFAFAPRVNIDDLTLVNERLLLDFNRLIFIQDKEKDTSSSNWFGSALYETKSNLLLPDTVSRETKVGDWQPSLSYSRSGIHYEDKTGQHIVGQLNDKKYVTIQRENTKKSLEFT